MSGTQALVVRVSMVLAVAGLALASDEWPKFCGPNHDNTSPAVGLAASWPAEGPTVVWEARITGSAPKDSGCFASPVVAGGKVFVVGRAYEQDPTTKAATFLPSPDVLHCLNAADGAELWKHELPPHAPFAGKSCWNTPVVDGPFVYVRGPDGELRCINVSDGKTAWAWPADPAELAKYIAEKKPIRDYGLSGPCLIVDDLVIFDIYAGFKAKLIALDKKTGQVRWEGKEYPCWQFSGGNMIPMDLGGTKVLLVNNNALDPQTGTHLIKTKDERGRDSNAWAPGAIYWVSTPQGKRLLTGFARARTVPKEQEAQEEQKYGKNWKQENGLALIEFARAEDGMVTTRTVWEWTQIGTGEPAVKAYGGPVIVGDYAYVFFGQRDQGVHVACLSLADGKEQWRVKTKHPLGYANPIAADGKIFYQWNGQVTMLAANPKEFQELSSAKVLGNGWSSPALAGTRLYVRDDAGAVKCLELKAP